MKPRVVDNLSIVHEVQIVEVNIRLGVLACLDWYSCNNVAEGSALAARKANKMARECRKTSAATTCILCITTKFPGEP